MSELLKNIRLIQRDQEFLDRLEGRSGQIYANKDTGSLRLYDGKTNGGAEVARADLANIFVDEFKQTIIDNEISTVVFRVTVQGPEGGDVGNKYVLNDVYRPQLNFVVGYTYVFVQDDPTNVFFPNDIGTTPNPHPLNFSADNLSGELGNGTSFLIGVKYFLDGVLVDQETYNGPAFNSATTRRVQITITSATPDELFYWCSNHPEMGNSIAVAEPGTALGVGIANVELVDTDLVFTLADDTVINVGSVIGPAGPSGEGTGDVITVGAPVTTGSLVRYSNTSGNNIEESLASVSNTGIVTAPAFSGNGVELTDLSANNLASGTVPVLRLGESGTRDDTTFLRGDNTWATVTGGDTSNSFETIAVNGQDNLVAASPTDTLTVAAGNNVIITTNSETNTITIASTAEGGSADFNSLTDASEASLTINQIFLQSVTRLQVTNSGSSAYLFDQYPGNNPTLFAVSGTTIAFDLNVVGHPFLIRTAAGTNFNTGLVHVGNDGRVLTGPAAQGQSQGTLYWKIPSDVSGNFQYICQFHSAMSGIIDITDLATIRNTVETRDTLTGTTGIIADQSTTNVNITGYKGYLLYKVETSAAAWVRIYVSNAARTADQGRDQGQDPLTGAGVVAEVITTGNETVLVVPGVIGFNNDSPVTTNIPLLVTNLSGGSADISVTLTAVETEI